MTRRGTTNALWALAAAAICAPIGCAQILGLDQFDNLCGGDLDQNCLLGGSGGAGTGATLHATSTGSSNPNNCSPGEQEACYTGTDQETQHHGICHSGTRTCGTNGVFGSCQGEQLPKAVDDCDNASDDDCNGKINDGCSCQHGDSMVCYDGPAGTAGTAACRSGTAVCNAQGSGFGACTGQVLPLPEDYDTAGDEDCNGIPSADTQWADAFSDKASSGALFLPATLSGAAFDVSGDLVIAGAVSNVGGVMSSIEFGSFTVNTSAGGSPGFLATLDPSGQPVAAVNASVRAPFAVDSQGHLAVAGGLLTIVDAAGATLSSVTCTGSGFALGTHVVVDASDAIIVAGQVSGAVTCGGKTLNGPASPAHAMFMAKIDAGGAVTWANAFGGSTTSSKETINALGLAPDGTIWIAGQVTDTVELQPFSTFFELKDHGAGDAFAAQFDVDGNVMAAGSWGDTAAQAANGMAIHPLAGGSDYTVAITGQNAGTIDLGGDALQATGAADGFAAVLTSALGHKWSAGFGAPAGTVSGVGIQIEPTGEAVVTGTVKGDIGFGPGGAMGQFSSGQATYAFLSVFDATGAFTWSKYFGGSTSSASARVVPSFLLLDPTTHYAWIAGSFSQPAQFGSGTKSEPAGGSVFVVNVATP